MSNQSESKKLRIGVIGTGLAFQELHLPVFAECPNLFEIKYLYSRTPAKTELAAKKVCETLGYLPKVCHDLDEILNKNDIDIIDIAVPINLTAKMVKEALKKGKHVFAEKPLAETVDEGIELIKLAKSKGLVLYVGENFRFQQKFYKVKEVVASGVIGKPKLYNLNDLHYTAPNSKYAATSWRIEGKHVGGYLIDGGTHIIAGMRAMVGSEVVLVHGLSASVNPDLFSKQDDSLLLNLSFANGVVGQCALGYGVVDREARKPKIYGKDGTVALLTDHIEIWTSSKETPVQQVPFNDNGAGFKEEWTDFYNGITRKSPLISPPEESILDLQVITLGMESAKTGKAIPVPKLFKK